MWNTREFKSWDQMKQRCLNPNNHAYAAYGGRGVKICREWLVAFLNFYRDMGIRPIDTSLDRIDNDGNYSCGHCDECVAEGWILNCRWATAKEQCNNRNNNHIIEFNNETLNTTQWAEKIGITVQALNQRINKLGWTLEQALNTPKRSRKK